MTTIPNYVQPTPDFSQGYIVTPTDWNSNFDGITSFFNTQIVPNMNALLAAPAPNVGAQSFFNARMTASPGVPYPTTNITGVSTINLTACNGNLIGLWDTGNSSWSNFALTSDIVLNVPTATRDLFDIYIYNNLGTLTLTTSPYATQAVTNNPAAGASIVCNVASTTNLAVGDIVSITDGSNQQEAAITNLVLNTSVTVDWLNTAFTAPTIRTAKPTVAVTTISGVLVSSADNAKRYVATILVVGNQVFDTEYHRGIGNAYNRIDRSIYIAAPAGYSQATGDKPANNSITLGDARAIFVAPAISVPTQYQLSRVSMTTGTPNPAYTTFYIDGAKHVQGGYTNTSSKMSVFANGSLSRAGRHFINEWFVNSAGGPIPIIGPLSGFNVSSTSGFVLN